MKPALLSALTYAGITMVMARDAWASLTTAIIGDLGDPLLNAAILAWNARQVPWTDAWFQFPAFFPTANALTFSEHLLGLSVIASPVYWVSRNAIAAYNVTLLLTYVMSGITMYALVWRLTRSAPASFLAGLAFAFAPFRAAHLTHVQVLASFYAPLALLGLHEFLDTRRPTYHRWRWLALFAVAWLLQGAANGYWLVFFSVLAGLWLLWFGVAERRWRDVGLTGAACGVAVLPMVPILARYVEAHRTLGLRRTAGEIAALSADIAAPSCVSPRLPLWRWVEGVCGPEGELFPGLAIPVICAGGLWWASRHPQRRRIVVFYLAAAVVMWAFSWGPVPRLGQEAVLPLGPYAVLMQIPGVDSLRVPARFWMMAVLCLATAAGVILASIFEGRRRTTVRALTVVAACVIVLDGWTTMAVERVPPAPPHPAGLRGGVVMRLPVEYGRDVAAQLHAVEGGWRSVNGASGFFPPHYGRLLRASAERDPWLFAPFLRYHDLHVVVEGDVGAHIQMAGAQPGAQVTGKGNGLLQFRIPSPGPRREPAGEPLAIAGLSVSCSPEKVAFILDGDAATRWECGPQGPRQQIDLDLGRIVPVGAVVPALGPYRQDHPRMLVVETSADGVSWQPAFEGDTSLDAFDALMSDPRTVPLTVAFPPRPARYVRLRLRARDDTWYWSIAELEVRAR